MGWASGALCPLTLTSSWWEVCSSATKSTPRVNTNSFLHRGQRAKQWTHYTQILTISQNKRRKIKSLPNVGGAYVVRVGVRCVVQDHGLGEVPLQDAQVFDVVSEDAGAVLLIETVPVRQTVTRSETQARDEPEGSPAGQRCLSGCAWVEASCEDVPKQLPQWVQDVDYLFSVFLLCRRINKQLEQNTNSSWNRDATDTRTLLV